MSVGSVGNAGLSQAMQTSIKGAKEQEVRVAKDAEKIVKGYAEAANAISTGNKEAITSETAKATAENDPVTAAVDMKTSVHAYKASLAAFKAADEMSEELLDIKA